MPHSHERGQALPLAAIVIAFVLLPLLILGLEVPRWFYIRQNLQIAADAASAAAASQAFDTQLFVNSGDVGYDLRIIFELVPHGGTEAILMQSVGTHDEVY